MKNIRILTPVLVIAMSCAAGFSSNAYGQACGGGGTFATAGGVLADVTGVTDPAVYSWYEYTNRVANKGKLGNVDFTCGFVETGDVCWFPNGAGLTIGGGDWGSATSCTGGGTVANTGIVISKNTATGGQVAAIVLADNPSPSANSDIAPNVGTSVLTAIPRVGVLAGAITLGVATGAGCAVGPCMTVAITAPTLPAAAFAKGGGVIANGNRGWIIYEQKKAAAPPTGGEGVRDANWVVSTLAAGGTASQSITTGVTFTVRTSQANTLFAAVPVFGGTGVSNRVAGSASNAPTSAGDTTNTGEEAAFLGQSLLVIPTGVGPGITGAASYENLKSVNVAWQTVSEINTAGFNISRSINQINWSKVNDTIVPATGIAGSGASYTFTDDLPRQRTYGKFYYKIEQLDMNGNVQTTLEVTVAR